MLAEGGSVEGEEAVPAHQTPNAKSSSGQQKTGFCFFFYGGLGGWNIGWIGYGSWTGHDRGYATGLNRIHRTSAAVGTPGAERAGKTVRR